MQKFYRRHRSTLIQFLKFGAIGGSGVLVNIIVFAITKNLIIHGQGRGLETALLSLGDLSIRWKHVPLTVAFVLANLWNFQLNRTFTFKSGKHAKWLREFVPFFMVGLGSFAIGFVIFTALTNLHWPTHLPTSIWDNSSPLRDRYNWANVIQIACVTPLNFVFSKIWAFKSVRTKNLAKAEAERARREALATGEPGATPVIGAEAAAVKPPCAD